MHRSLTFLTEKLDAVQVEFSVMAYIHNKMVTSLAAFALTYKLGNAIDLTTL